MRLSRRAILLGCTGALIAPVAARADSASLTFDQIYSKMGVLGFEFSPRTRSLAGQDVTIRGYMAPPLKAEAKFFVLGSAPMAICPFCSSDADWPDNIVVIYLDEEQTFTTPGQPIDVTGWLEIGSWSDPETGFVSQLRLRSARYVLA